MNSTRKIVIGLGLAGSALLTAWLLTGERKKRTKDFVVRRAQNIRQAIKKDKFTPDDPDRYYYL
jgi:hypothetical protein